MATQKTETREARGIALHRSCGHEIIQVEAGVYRVPASEGGGFYRVDMEREICECRDHQHRRVRCLHFYAALIFAAKKRCRRATARPDRRHSVQRPKRERPTNNTPAPRDTTTPRRTDGVPCGA